MNWQQNTILMILSLLGAAALASFAGSTADRIPKGWSKAGSHPHNYEVALDAVVKHGDKAGAYIKFTGAGAEGFCTLMQSFKANGYHGKRVRMSAWVRTENADSAQLWLRLDSAKGMVGFDNMDNRPVRGTVDWKKYEIVLDVPANTVNVAFGALLAGKGQAWVDDFVFEVVGNILTTEQTKGGDETPASDKYPAQPINLNFEEDQVTGAEYESNLARDKAAADAARSWLADNAIRKEYRDYRRRKIRGIR
jgi:hypothetical protein